MPQEGEQELEENWRNESGIEVSIFSLKKGSLKSRKGYSNFQIYLLSSINSKCLISIRFNKVIQSLQNIFLSNRRKPCTIHFFPRSIATKSSALNNCKQNQCQYFPDKKLIMYFFYQETILFVGKKTWCSRIQTPWDKETNKQKETKNRNLISKKKQWSQKKLKRAWENQRKSKKRLDKTTDKKTQP